ncbi:MAG TPA: Hsp20/alpha crystallin family protein [Smithellaceae bacterium]|nr:Hsp20/alpha crystallin family protein [Smithellaceae bacterium]
MNFIKIKFGNNFEDEFQKAVDEVFHLVSPVFKQYECVWRPPVDVCELGDEIIVLADLAGINKEELHIELSSKRIKISGIRKMVSVVADFRYCLAEIPHGYFERSIPLPALVDAEKASASYADGILMVRINKIPAGKAHRISVKTG